MAKERRWPVDQLVLMVLDLEVVSLTLKLPEVWGNTSKAGMVLDLEVVSLTLKLQVVSLTLKLWLKSGVKSGGG